MNKEDIYIFNTPDELGRAAAEYIITTASQAADEKGKFTIVLSGGETPKRLYALLAKKDYSGRIPWKHTYVFWGDERCVDLTDSRNNALQAKEILLNHVPIPSDHIYPIQANLKPEVAAGLY